LLENRDQIHPLRKILDIAKTTGFKKVGTGVNDFFIFIFLCDIGKITIINAFTL